MTKEDYLTEISNRLNRHFTAALNGYKTPDSERHRLEGFIQGAIFMEFASRRELNERMEAIHQSVFGQSIRQRREESHSAWQEPAIDYGLYDQPAFERNAK